MKMLKRVLLLVGTMAALSFGTAQVNAQGQGNFDPEQMRQRMLERIREQLGVTKDDEWKIISERVEKVMAARREVPGGFGGGFFGRGGRRGGGNGGGDNAQNADRPQRRFGPEESQAEKDLRAAIEAKAPADEIKAKLEKFREYKKSKEADLAKAQEKLKEVLSQNQEAAAVLAGLLQ